MISFDDDNFIKFHNMGLFVGGEGWIHPKATVTTHELIFVTKGVVYIQENDKRMVLQKGDMVCLKPNIAHFGYEKSDFANFFWLHFDTRDYSAIGPDCLHVADSYNAEAMFKQLNHLAVISSDEKLIECRLMAFLLDLKSAKSEKNKLFCDICEYIRVNISSAPQVKDIADKFMYSADYLSKIFIKCSGLPLKKYIDRERVSLVCNMLLTTSMSLKEIAEVTGFESDNALTKFFKYNHGQSPSQFRNNNYASHTNIR